MKTTGRPLQFACFACRKCFKRPQASAGFDRFMTSAQAAGQRRAAAQAEAARGYKCPDCAGPAHFMGLDFKAPKRADLRAWRAAQARIEAGGVFYRGGA
jgi:hypothetical protein